MSMGETGCGKLEPAAPHKNLFSARGLQLLPELIRTADERNVLRRLGVGMADDPRLTTMAPLIVDVVKLLEDQSFQAAFAKCPSGGRSHRSSAKDDDVKMVWW